MTMMTWSIAAVRFTGRRQASLSAAVAMAAAAAVMAVETVRAAIAELSRTPRQAFDRQTKSAGTGA